MARAATDLRASGEAGKGRLALWVRGARPRTLTLSAVPVLVGNALAFAEGHGPSLWVLVATLLAAVLIQAATNLYNDALDSLRGVDDRVARRGPPRVVASGWMSAGGMLAGAHAALAAALLVGVFLSLRGGWPILAVGVASLAAAYFYSAGPRPIAARPTGEAFVIVFFGLAAVAGSYYLQSGGVILDAWVHGLSLGLAAAAVLLVNNYRDVETDRAAGRRTLVMVLGRRGAARLYGGLLLLPLMLSAGVVLRGSGPGWALLPLMLLPWAFLLARSLPVRDTADGMNRLLAATVGFHFGLGALVSAGAVLGR